MSQVPSLVFLCLHAILCILFCFLFTCVPWRFHYLFINPLLSSFPPVPYCSVCWKLPACGFVFLLSCGCLKLPLLWITFPLERIGIFAHEQVLKSIQVHVSLLGLHWGPHFTHHTAHSMTIYDPTRKGHMWHVQCFF